MSPYLRLLSTACLVGLTACQADRKIRVISRPSGATVYFDDVEVGETPIEFPYRYYGVRRVTLEKEGFRRESTVFELKAPWYSYFPFDVFSELINPIPYKDHYELTFVLARESGDVAEPDLDALLRRADRLRRAGPLGPAGTRESATEGLTVDPVSTTDSAPTDDATHAPDTTEVEP
ncbi:MAG: PEGA domain-containing protein [Planctomycetes bacterium]|nr:PEGA domain-containing protein [Planctomycetota bacterium]MCB9904645.1 PEGA domain-containing protein [Planctomycetota bacterium]